MSLLSYNELCQLVEQNVITGVKPKDINATSIDVHLGDKIIIESSNYNLVDIANRTMWASVGMNITNYYYDLQPGEFVLASTRETFNLPNDISAEFRLKSSGARSGLNNLFACHCLLGDTQIATLDGKSVSIESLCGTDGVWVYAISQDGHVVVAKSSGSWVTKHVETTLKVTLDNGESFSCTPDHKVLTRWGGYVEAQHLPVGASLMPLNRRHNHEGREEVYCPNPKAHENSGLHSGRWWATHRIVGETVLGGVPEGSCVHHKDFGIHDNNPENLEVITAAEHISIHATERNSRPEMKVKASANMKKTVATLWNDPQWVERKNARSSEVMREQNTIRWADPAHREAMLPFQKASAVVNFKSVPKEVVQRAAKLGMVRSAVSKILGARESVNQDTYTRFKRQNAPTVATLCSVFGSFDSALREAGYENHKVVSVEEVKHESPVPVYDISVPEHHNFGLSCGAFVHNCDPGWNGSALTLELKNELQHHPIRLTAGMAVGQMLFHRVTPVPKERSYAVLGRYNGDTGVQGVKL